MDPQRHEPDSKPSGTAATLVAGLLGLLVGAGLGAGTMFLLDPQSGRRRRALVRDRVVHWKTLGGEELGDRMVDLGHRSRGLAARVRARLRREEVGAGALAARVRSRLGRVASNPAAIAVSAEDGRVTLRGSVPPDELEDVLDEVSSVHGVREVYNLLQVQWSAPSVPGNH